MTEEQIKAKIAKVVCERFVNMGETTKRHAILVGFENPDVLDQMVQRTLIRTFGNRNDYLPTVGTFALLGDDNELYQDARVAFEKTTDALWNLYRSEGCEVDHEPVEFAVYANKLYPDPIPHRLITLGLYLAVDFGALSTMKMSADQMAVERFRVAEQVIRMRDPVPWWTQRVVASRAPLQRFGIPFDMASAGPDAEPCEEDVASATSDASSLWSLIHPEVSAEARPRFEAGYYSDAVEWALKVVAEKVRGRTGLTTDGSDLMHSAFSPKKPRLVFDDPIASTRDSMQQGYMELFAGTMTGIRNPKAHGMVRLDQRRCLHFLFLASLLADKVDEAVDTNKRSLGSTPQDIADANLTP
jgi:uncharacterized protein (TIGR02391 family)